MARAARTVAFAAVLVLAAGCAFARAGEVPRFASLKASEANLRAGPGTRYPVEWVFVKSDVPLEIIAEFGNWRKIRDITGTVGWMHQSMLSGRRTVMVTGGPQRLRREPSENAAVVAVADETVIGRLLHCKKAWCEVEIRGVQGWIKRDGIWGVYAGETLE